MYAFLGIVGNRLGDEGANHLWQVLNTLPNLMALNLSGNGLTELSLSNLATTLDRTREGGGRVLQVSLYGCRYMMMQGHLTYADFKSKIRFTVNPNFFLICMAEIDSVCS